MKLCECGCGQPAPIAPVTNSRRGWFKGQSKRFISGHNNTKHGANRRTGKTPEYISFQCAKKRCTNPNDDKWNDYGGRGIQFKFDSFAAFLTELGSRPIGKTLNRINNDGHYEPGNVNWASYSEQNRNQRGRISVTD